MESHSRKGKSRDVSWEQPCFFIMGNLPPTTIPIQMETWKWVGFNKHTAPVCNCINDQHLCRLVNLEGKSEVGWGFKGLVDKEVGP